MRAESGVAMGGKWVKGLSGEMPVAEAARRVLEERLLAVGKQLPGVLEGVGKDPEPVHQLRVGSRRAAAALRLFGDCLPGKAAKKAKKKLRKLRQAAGEPRDWDVFRMEVLARRAERPAGEHAGLDFLAGYALGRRHAAQPALEAACRGAMPFAELVGKTVGAVRRSGNGETLGARAARLIAELAEGLQEPEPVNGHDNAGLHQVRIRGKQLRYAMEVFGACFPEAFRAEVYPQVEQLQEMLGRLNDSHVAVLRLTELCGRIEQACPELWPEVRPGVEEWVRGHKKRMASDRGRFRRWWSRWQAEGGPALREMTGAPAAG
jgi:CHAD domain-containing protein